MRPSRAFAVVAMLLAGAGGCADDLAHRPTTVKPGSKLGPPPQGLYLGMAEREPGQVYAFEHAIGRKAPLFWPKTHGTYGTQEGVLDDTYNFDPALMQQSWDAGYALMSGFEPHPENGMRVDDVLLGKHDRHLERLAGQIKAFAQPMFFGVAREPNGVLALWKGGYGPDGDKDIAWADSNKRTHGEFDPSGFPHPELYAGLGDPQLDDALERLAALQRYLHDFLVNRHGIDFVSFETMGWVAANPNDEVPTIGPDFISLHRMIADSSDWISLNWYTLGGEAAQVGDGGDGGHAPLDTALGWLHAYVQAIREAGIDKPIMLTEFGLCAPPADRAALVTRVLETLINDYPEIKGVSIWNIPGCRLDDQLGYPEIKQVIDRNPDKFHSCLYLTDGSPVPGCDPSPSELLPKPPKPGDGNSNCMDTCLASGETRPECEEAC